jgi:hypothetical protein
MTIRTVAVKIVEGIHSQRWTVSGYGGSWAGAARPIQDYIERKVARAVQAEREACAQVADREADGEDPNCCVPVAWRISTAIRARGEK